MMMRVAGPKSRVFAILAGVGLVFSLSLSATDAQARPKKKGKRPHVITGYTPPFAALVIDANTNKVLYAKNENELRHPASVTKVMTLYMLFEQLERGKMTLDTPIRISRHAASMKPSKLYLSAGEEISAEDAIKALVTRSANDVAAAIAEHIGGSEPRFADMMTAKARSIGMTRTFYANASGLPDKRQVTTARDLVLLGRAIQERFPKYYGYFATSNFRYAGQSIRNHNNLLGRIEGVDGIKTGYTNASGFNLLTSVRRDGQHVVAAVLGGTSAASRDRIMANLIEDKIQYASHTKTAPSVFANARMETVVTAKAQAKPAQAESAARPVQVASTEPVAYQGVSVESANRPSLTAAAVVPPTQANGMRWVNGAQAADAPAPKMTNRAEPKFARVEPAAPAKKVAVIEKPQPVKAKGVMIQVGATDKPAQAQALISRAKSASKGTLAKATPVTEKVSKGRQTVYRARFAGLTETQAEAACKSLKRSGMSCFTAKN
jgi:D-alanyl-D-alanine carboxypeptidase